MYFDLVGGIELTASAGIVIAILAAGLSETWRTRAAIAAGFGAWFSMVTALAATEAFHQAGSAGLLGLGTAVFLPVAVMVGAAIWSDRVREAIQRIPLSSLVAVNTVRILGVSFVMLYALGRLPAPFAPVAGWGDIAVGLTAPLVAWLIATRGAAARSVLVIWNAVGLADLIVAVGLGVTSAPGPLQLIGSGAGSGLMTTLPWLLIPGFLVPTLACTHLAVFYRLRAGVEPVAEAAGRQPSTVTATL